MKRNVGADERLDFSTEKSEQRRIIRTHSYVSQVPRGNARSGKGLCKCNYNLDMI